MAATAKRAMAAVLVCTFFLTNLSACSTPPEKIAPSYVSPLQYSNYTCDQIVGEMRRISRQVMVISGQQKSEANKDAVAMGVGLVLFWPALFFLIGDDKKNELSVLKGEYDALHELAAMKSCEMTFQNPEVQQVKLGN